MQNDIFEIETLQDWQSTAGCEIETTTIGGGGGSNNCSNDNAN